MQTPFDYTELFMPHGHCVLWRPLPLGLHVGSDVVTALSYIIISGAIAFFFYKRRDLIERRLYVLFSAFILLCGLGHAFAAVNFWQAYYLSEGALKAVTASVSLITAVVVVLRLPIALDLPSPMMLKRIRAENVRLRKELENLKNG